MRRPELLLLGLFVLSAILAAVAGIRSSRVGDVFDRRSSTRVHSPSGAKGLASALTRLGVPVEERRRPLFGLGAEGRRIDGSELLVLLDLTVPPSAGERRSLRRYVERGGGLFVGAVSTVEGCFGVGVGELEPKGDVDSVAIEKPPGVGPVPAVETGVHLVQPGGGEVEADDAGAGEPDLFVLYGDEEACRLEPLRADTVLATVDGRPVALKLWFDGGGRVTVLGETAYLSNEVLKETDAGVLMLPLLLAERPSRVIFDEYHHGFGRRRSIWMAALRWLGSTPVGWGMLQLLALALLALAVAAVRFGPALSVVRRERRSAIEHLDALAMGLQRAGDRTTAITLIIEGLRRRLSRGVILRRATEAGLRDWLTSLSVAVASAEARAAVDQLRSLAREGGGDEDVLKAALNVERLWSTLGK